MFTGLIEECGEVLALTRTDSSARLRLRALEISRAIQLGDSVAVNGCCLTVSAHDGNELTFDLLRETLERTNLGDLTAGSVVNLERAVAVGSRLGGHFVQGHIDCTSPVRSFEARGADYRLEIELPAEFARYVAFKGSIAIDGISLTVAEVNATSFVAWIIPHTYSVTSLQGRRAGSRVNLEFDLLAKYVERILGVCRT